MVRLETQALVVAVRRHGEHGAIVRALTPEAGVQAGYVRGGKSRRLRPVLVPGNSVQTEYRARTAEQLPHLTVELVHSRAFLLSEPLAAAAIEWACALTAAALPEGQPYPRLYEGLDGLLTAVEAAPSARGWSGALASYELLMLNETGFGHPRAVLGEDWASVHETLKRTGYFLERDLLTGRQSEVLAARERLIERLKRIGG
ncbi:MAG TPA: recombination protein O N-terminal domain-containing protein [Allosphingosinicella sp.]|nr:recombination protein O N-terminal domain-containing protein [Allosphingosinicella sp.]